MSSAQKKKNKIKKLSCPIDCAVHILLCSDAGHTDQLLQGLRKGFTTPYRQPGWFLSELVPRIQPDFGAWM